MLHATVGQIAQMVGLHPNTIRNWTDEGIIECRKDFRGWRRFPNPLKTVREIEELLKGERMPENKGSGK
jgi:DNA-binding transcriptional MerR regulator